MLHKYRVFRKTKPKCDVMICPDRATGKYCFVNLTSGHVCACRFDSIEDALNDLRHRSEVTYFEPINDKPV